jgi:transposase-like protein
MAISHGAFTPPHCPNHKCRFHKPPARGWRYKKAGFFTRSLAPRRIQRYHCHACGRYFSTQTFHVSYWLKRPEVVATLLTKAVGCMANRQIARDLGVSPTTVDHQLQRLGRHCLLYHAQQIAQAKPPREVAIDGFETFEHSQYYPFHFNVCVETHSDFFLGFTESELRRKGRMTPDQRARRRELERRHGRPDPAAIRTQMAALLQQSVGRSPEVTIHSDDHPAYPIAIHRLKPRVTHRVTPSRAYRGPHNPLFPVNLLDLLIRHSQAGHRRETIAFAKQRVSSAARLAILLVWRNYIHRRREKVRGSPTPAMVRGMASNPLKVTQLLQCRLFYAHTGLSPRWRCYYRRLIRTRALPRHRTHHLTYAF